MIIDDDQDSLDLLSDILDSNGYDVTSFDQSAEALRCIMALEAGHGSKPDVIFVDFVMPKVRGDSLVELVKTSKNTADIPVVMVSGKLQGKYMGDAISAGCDEIIIKPYEPKQIADVLERLAIS